MFQLAMDSANINQLLDAHDRVPTKGEAVQFKRSLGTNTSLRQQRDRSREFFHNPDMTTNLKIVDSALKGIVEEEKNIKRNIKRQIAKEEYEHWQEEPSKEAKKHKLMIPPDMFETEEHFYVSDEEFNNFSCNHCNFSSNSEQTMIKHMEKKRKEAWTQMLEEKLNLDKRCKEWYESPSDFKHLAVKHNLPNPDIENRYDSDEGDNHENMEDFVTPGTSKATRVPLRVVRELNQEKEKVRRISGELDIVKTKNKICLEKNVERGIRAELKRRKLLEEGVENKTVEVLEKVGSIFKVKTTKIIEEKSTGRIRRCSQTQTLVDVTTRGPYKKTNTNDNEITSEAMRTKAKKIVEVTNELTRNPEEAGKVHAKAIDMQEENMEFSDKFKNQSKIFKEKDKLTLEEAATLHLATNQTRRGLRKTITAMTKLNKNILPSESKIMQELKKQTTIDENDYKQETKLIHKTKQGDKAARTEKTAVTIVNNFEDFVIKIVKAEIDHLEGRDEITLTVCFDAGGKRVVSELVIVNRNDKKVKPHIILIFEGTDNYENMNSTLGTLSVDIKKLNGTTITVGDKTFKLKFKTVLDGSAVNTVMGRQTSSANKPCVWTDVTKEHLSKENHAGKDHNPENCPEINFTFKDEYRDNLKNNLIKTVKNGKQVTRQTLKNLGKEHGNVIGSPIIDLPEPLDNSPTVMHIVNGLLNDTLDEEFKDIAEEDKKEYNFDNRDDTKVKRMEELEEKREELEIELDEITLAASVHSSDIKRFEMIKTNIKDAEEEANKCWTKQAQNKERKKNCTAYQCVIFPVDETNKYDPKIECKKCKNENHLRCEGLVDYEDTRTEYTCNKCEGGNEKNQHTKIKKAQTIVDGDMAAVQREIQEVETEVNHLENEMEDDLGPRQKIFKQSFKRLKINCSQYFAKSFGGSLEGNQVQKIFSEAKDDKWTILETIEDKPKLVEKNKEAIKCLAEVDLKLKKENDSMTDEEVKDIKQSCEKWGHVWPKYFQNRNITPKGHWLCFVVPKFVEVNRTFHMFYRCEQACEKIHAILNNIERNLLHVQNKHERHRILIARYEQRHGCDIDICVPVKRNLKHGHYVHTAAYWEKRGAANK